MRNASSSMMIVWTIAAASSAAAFGEDRPDSDPRSEAERQIAAGPFEPTWESLAAGYRCPEWFRDAKFGIWAHWSAQCQPEMGDWYARRMYIQGEKQYEHHRQTYGHPSEFGFMEFDNLWRAENWEPEKLMRLYKAAGAKYFVALANHHDNFDCYDSKHHAWNSVRVGPQRDIVGTWAKVTREAGLRFGVSNHSAHAWHWFQPAYGYDPEGPKAGVRYDAFRLTKADGAGKWWEGLDPQELYTGPNMVMPDGITSIKAANAWHQENDGQWLETPPPNNPQFVEKWFLRAQDLVDKYTPDLMYLDNTELPLGQAGLDFAAHYYNSNLAHRGKLEAVLNTKNLTPEHRPAMVLEFERGFAEEILPLPWQTCSCIGSWHYERDVKYKSVEQVVRMLLEIVSKNGNLLLSIPVRGDGTIDDDAVTFLADLAKWMDVHGEGIFGTRPWHVYGEGPTKAGGGMFSEREIAYTPQDMRFTTKDAALYVFVMARPTDDVTIKSLASDDANSRPIAGITLLGLAEQIQWEQTPDGLVITKPAALPAGEVCAFRVVFE